MNCLRAIAWGLNTACDILWPVEETPSYEQMLADAEAETEVWEPMESGGNELPDELWSNEGLDALNRIAVYVEDIRNTLAAEPTCEGCGGTSNLWHTIDCPAALAEAHADLADTPEQFAKYAAYWLRRYADSDLCEAPSYWRDRAAALDPLKKAAPTAK